MNKWILLLASTLLFSCASDDLGGDLDVWFVNSRDHSLVRIQPDVPRCDVADFLSSQVLALAAFGNSELYGLNQNTRELMLLRPFGGGEEIIGTVSPLDFPQSLAVSSSGALYLLDNNSSILRLNPETAAIIQQWTLPAELYASLFFSPISFESPTGVFVEPGDLLGLRQEAGTSVLLRLDLGSDPAVVRDLMRLGSLRSICASSLSGRFYASTASRTLLELDPSTGDLEPILEVDCALEEAAELSSW